MSYVTLETEAAESLSVLPERMKPRMMKLIRRLEKWPEVSGARPLRGPLAGRYRLRTGDYRLQFRVVGDEVVIERIGHRDKFYGE